jgi:hypothetical protein
MTLIYSEATHATSRSFERHPEFNRRSYVNAKARVGCWRGCSRCVHWPGTLWHVWPSHSRQPRLQAQRALGAYPDTRTSLRLKYGRRCQYQEAWRRRAMSKTVLGRAEMQPHDHGAMMLHLHSQPAVHTHVFLERDQHVLFVCSLPLARPCIPACCLQPNSIQTYERS